MMPFGADMLVATSAYNFRTDQNNNYKGYTVYPYKTPNSAVPIPGQQLLTIEEVSIQRSWLAKGGLQVQFQTISKVESLTVV